MTLVTTVAGATTDSYLTVDQADALAEKRLGREAEGWLNASVTDKEKALRQAAVDIDTLAGPMSPYDDLQALAFPRTTDLDSLYDPLIPNRVLLAQYEQAAYLLANADVISNAATRRARGLFSFAEDNLSGSISLDDSTGLIAPRAMQLMSAITSRTRSTLRSVPLSTRTWPLDA